MVATPVARRRAAPGVLPGASSGSMPCSPPLKPRLRTHDHIHKIDLAAESLDFGTEPSYGWLIISTMLEISDTFDERGEET